MNEHNFNMIIRLSWYTYSPMTLIVCPFANLMYLSSKKDNMNFYFYCSISNASNTNSLVFRYQHLESILYNTSNT